MRAPSNAGENAPNPAEGVSVTIVILAAGAAHRMGTQKLLLPVDGQPIIERVLRAASAWPIVVVAGAEVAHALRDSRALRIIVNDAPERGMAHSLALGNAAVDAAEAIAVLLGDLPDITPHAIAAVVDAFDDTVDVVVPRCGDAFTHPVAFGPRARRKVAELPEGDTIKRLRDDPSLRRRIVKTEPGTGTDIDTPGDYFRRTQGCGAAKEITP